MILAYQLQARFLEAQIRHNESVKQTNTPYSKAKKN